MLRDRPWWQLGVMSHPHLHGCPIQLAADKPFCPASAPHLHSEADPITVEEAIDALEAVGHSFYVFREMTTDTVQVRVHLKSRGLREATVLTMISTELPCRYWT